jgi:hypothetical protein
VISAHQDIQCGQIVVLGVSRGGGGKVGGGGERWGGREVTQAKRAE